MKITEEMVEKYKKKCNLKNYFAVHYLYDVEKASDFVKKLEEIAKKHKATLEDITIELETEHDTFSVDIVCNISRNLFKYEIEERIKECMEKEKMLAENRKTAQKEKKENEYRTYLRLKKKYEKKQ